MRKKQLISLVLMIAFPAIVGLGVTEAEATCSGFGPGECFDDNGRTMNIVRDGSGNWPTVVGPNTKFTYQVTPAAGTAFVSALLTNHCNGSGGPTKVSSNPFSLVEPVGAGSMIGDFGENLTSYRVIDWFPPGFGFTGLVEVTMAGLVGAEEADVHLGLVFPVIDRSSGRILLPACPPAEVENQEEGFSATGQSTSVRVRTDPFTKSKLVEVCDNNFGDCELAPSRPQSDYKGCLNVDDFFGGGAETCDGNIVDLVPPGELSTEEYCCEFFAGTEPGETYVDKEGEDSFCSMIIGGRMYRWC